MSEFVSNKLNPDNINGGKKFNKGDGFSASDLNQIVEGVMDSEGSSLDDLTYTKIVPSINTTEIPIIDSHQKTIYIPNDTVLISNKLKGGYVSIKGGTYSYSNATSSAVCICWDIVNSTIIGFNYNAKIDVTKYLLIATIRKGNNSTNKIGKIGSITPMIIDGLFMGVINISETTEETIQNKTNSLIRVINHRGYNAIAPENTLSAYKLSKTKGFEYVECDVRFTSDKIAVLLHDATINRTARNADGTTISETINIEDITYEQALSYDFGCWKSSNYAGEKIPTLEEFILLCKRIGLKPYVELKDNSNQEEVGIIVNIIKRCGILKNTTFISFGDTTLEKVLNIVPNARIGLVVSNINDTVINWCINKKTDSNEVFLDVYSPNLTDEKIEQCAQNNIPIEVWSATETVNGLVNIDEYVSGYTVDKTLVNEVFYDNYIE